jgi:hypothetical protein
MMVDDGSEQMSYQAGSKGDVVVGRLVGERVIWIEGTSSKY